MAMPIAIGLFFFNDTATTEIYTLSLHDALPISARTESRRTSRARRGIVSSRWASSWRSEEHTSELQSRSDLVCRRLLEKKKHDGAGLDRGSHRRHPCLYPRARRLDDFGGAGRTRPPGAGRALCAGDRRVVFLRTRRTPRSTLFPYTTLFR